MALPLLGYSNRAVGATLSGGSWQASWPRTNAQDIVLARVARSTDAQASSTRMRLDLGAAAEIRIVAITGHTGTAAATITVAAASTQSGLAAPAYSVTQDVWRGGNRPANTAMHVPCALVILPAGTSWRWWDVSMADATNPAGSVEWGYLQLWEALELPRGPSFSPTLAPETGTIRQETIGLVGHFDRRPSRRTTRFSVAGLPLATADRILDIVRDRDLDQPVFWVPDPAPADPGRLLRRAFLARARVLSALEQPYTIYEGAAFELQEVVGG